MDNTLTINNESIKNHKDEFRPAILGGIANQFAIKKRVLVDDSRQLSGKSQTRQFAALKVTVNLHNDVANEGEEGYQESSRSSIRRRVVQQVPYAVALLTNVIVFFYEKVQVLAGEADGL